ncbi:hypothetical protein B0H19DRAFT_1085795 [Mycena capillaripes]|nr:hypothetical protein B0H19DRAFT_1085795 [Mycena capillaripes]
MSLSLVPQTIKQNNANCIELVEQTDLHNTIITSHQVYHTGRTATEAQHKVHTFVEAQQNSRKLFRQGEMSSLLKDCRLGLQQETEFFQIHATDVGKGITKTQRVHGMEILAVFHQSY